MSKVHEKSTLPILDISGWTSDASDQVKDKIAANLHQVCKTIGFFYLKGHDVEQELMEEVQ